MHAPAPTPGHPSDCESRAGLTRCRFLTSAPGSSRPRKLRLPYHLPASSPAPGLSGGMEPRRAGSSKASLRPQSKLSRGRSTGRGVACEGAGLGWLLRGPRWPWAAHPASEKSPTTWGKAQPRGQFPAIGTCFSDHRRDGHLGRGGASEQGTCRCFQMPAHSSSHTPLPEGT